MSRILRPYQEDAIRAAFRHQAGQIKLAYPDRKGAMVVLPTGCGKTFTALKLIDRFLEFSASKGRKPRVSWLAHRHELIVQPVRDFMRFFPAYRAYTGIVNASTKQFRAQVRFASIDTLKTEKNLRNFVAAGRNDLLIVDECHHAVAPGWAEVIWGDLGIRSEMLVGLTATPIRQDDLNLWDRWDPVSSLTIEEAIRDGYLTPYRMVEELVDLDLAEVPTKGDDYDADQLGAMLLKSGVVNTTAKAVRLHAPKPGGAPGLVFCATVEQAELTSTALRGLGYASACLDGGASPKEREDMVQALRTGKLQVLTNCHVLTEGFDCPAISWVVFARPFKSLSLYFQAAGRALRPDPSKRKGEPATLINLTPHAPRSLSLPTPLLELLSRLCPPPPARPSAEPPPAPSPLDAPASPPGGVSGLAGLLSSPDKPPPLAPVPLPALLASLAPGARPEAPPWPPSAPAPVLVQAGPGVALLAPVCAAPSEGPVEASGARVERPAVDALPLLGALPEGRSTGALGAADEWVGWWFAPHPSGGLSLGLPVPLAKSPLPYDSLMALVEGFVGHAYAAERAARRAGQPVRGLEPDQAAHVVCEWLASGLWAVLV